MKFIFSLIIIISIFGCASIQVITNDETIIFQKINSLKKSNDWVQIYDQMSNNGNYWFVDSVGNFSIIGQTKEDKEQWRNFLVWKVFYDDQMPRACFGKFKNGEKLFKALETKIVSVKKEYDSLNSNCDNANECEKTIWIISHTASYDFEIRSDGKLFNEEHIYLNEYERDGEKLSPESYSDIVKSVLNIFNNSGLNHFKWKPKNQKIEYLNCSA